MAQVSDGGLYIRAGISSGHRHGLVHLPDADNLARFAFIIKVPYEAVLDAALHDAAYLPRPEVAAGPHRLDVFWKSAALDEEAELQAARRTPTGRATPGQQRRRQLDEAGEESQDPSGDA
jgi:hypothetical protein